MIKWRTARIDPLRLAAWKADCASRRAPAYDWVSDVEPQVQQALLEAFGPCQVYLFDPEVIVYTAGEGIGAHRDRPRAAPEGSEHAGTLLCVSGRGVEGGHLTSEEGKVLLPTDDHSHLVYVPLTVRHWVTPVEAGTRVVAKASVALAL